MTSRRFRPRVDALESLASPAVFLPPPYDQPPGVPYDDPCAQAPEPVPTAPAGTVPTIQSYPINPINPYTQAIDD